VKKHLMDFMAHNKPYVSGGAVMGADGAKRLMANAMLKLAKRNFQFVLTREQGIEWLLKQK
jgi:hypothetical protein